MKATALRRRYGHSRMGLGPGEVDAKGSASLPQVKLAARNRGDLHSAIVSAGYYAKKRGKTMYVYPGNSYGVGVWRVSSDPSEYLDPINNTGSRVASISPDLTMMWHEIDRNAGRST